MAKIRIDLNEPFLDGMDIKFKAPCDCTAVDGMTVYYPLDDDSGTGNQSFVFKDAHGNTLTGLGNLFAKNAVVKVIVDRTTGSAYIQNAATNAYLEDKIANAGSKVTLSSSVTSTSTTTAANSYAVKQAYDKGVSALSEAQSAQEAANNLSAVSEGTIGPISDTSDYATLTIKWAKCGRMVNLSFTLVTNQDGGPTFIYNMGDLAPLIDGITTACEDHFESSPTSNGFNYITRLYTVSVYSGNIGFHMPMSAGEQATIKGSICYISKS